MNGDVCVAAETAQRPSKGCLFCGLHKDDTLCADEVDQKYAHTVSANDDKDLYDDAIYYTILCE